MITKKINHELKGLHGSAFVLFGERIGATTTVEALRCLVELSPEYKKLSEIPVWTDDSSTASP